MGGRIIFRARMVIGLNTLDAPGLSIDSRYAAACQKLHAQPAARFHQGLHQTLVVHPVVAGNKKPGLNVGRKSCHATVYGLWGEFLELQAMGGLALIDMVEFVLFSI